MFYCFIGQNSKVLSQKIRTSNSKVTSQDASDALSDIPEMGTPEDVDDTEMENNNFVEKKRLSV
jgi:hypothetical protein